ncbi:MAG: hypothetical protein FWC54_00280 [Actinomycetia bacterium]|nr:hypothetical protein [Actinomycetes bacterium]
MGGTHLLMIESIAMAGLEGAVQRHNEQILRPAPAGLNSASDDEESSAGEADD